MTDRTAAQLIEAQAQGASAESIARAFLGAIRARDSKLKAFLHVDEEAVLEQARGVDRKRRAGAARGLLAGVPGPAIPAAGSASRRRGAASWASSRLTGACRAADSLPSPARSTRSARSLTMSRIALCCWR